MLPTPLNDCSRCFGSGIDPATLQICAACAGRYDRVYFLSSPYSDNCSAVRERRFREALLAVVALTRHGHIVFSPIVHGHPLTAWPEFPFRAAHWRRQNRAFLLRSNAVIVLCAAGWEFSVGVQSEITEAKVLRIPVFYMFQSESGWALSAEEPVGTLRINPPEEAQVNA